MGRRGIKATHQEALVGAAEGVVVAVVPQDPIVHSYFSLPRAGDAESDVLLDLPTVIWFWEYVGKGEGD